jgi:hypothetical protein
MRLLTVLRLWSRRGVRSGSRFGRRGSVLWSLEEAIRTGGIGNPIAGRLDVKENEGDSSIVLDRLAGAVCVSMGWGRWRRVDVREEIPWSGNVFEGGRRGCRESGRVVHGRGGGSTTEEDIFGKRIRRGEREDLAELGTDPKREGRVAVGGDGGLNYAESDLGGAFGFFGEFYREESAVSVELFLALDADTEIELLTVNKVRKRIEQKIDHRSIGVRLSGEHLQRQQT